MCSSLVTSESETLLTTPGAEICCDGIAYLSRTTIPTYDGLLVFIERER